MSDRLPSPAAAPIRDALAPTWLLRAEGFALLVAACVAYRWASGAVPDAYGWGVFAALFFVPDVAMLGYLRSARVGALLYNLVHTETPYVALLGWGLFAHSGSATSVALIGLAHIGFDRFAGYGLKYATAFGDTHLTRRP